MNSIDTNNIICEKIAKIVVYYFKFPDEEHMFKFTRKREIVRPRQIYLFMCKKFTKLSLESIGKIASQYGRTEPLNHATVLHAIKTIKNLCETDKELLYDVNKIQELILDEINTPGEVLKEAFKEKKSNIDLRKKYESIIFKMKLDHKKEIDTLKTSDHPIYSELKSLNKKKLEFFYNNRWLPFKKTNVVL